MVSFRSSKINSLRTRSTPPHTPLARVWWGGVGHRVQGGRAIGVGKNLIWITFHFRYVSGVIEYLVVEKMFVLPSLRVYTE